MKKLVLTMALVAVLVSCKEEEKPATLETKGAREVELSSVEQGGNTLHITTQTVWMNGVVVKKDVDTLITASPKAVKDSVEDDNGDVKVIEHAQKLPIFVTVK